MIEKKTKIKEQWKRHVTKHIHKAYPRKTKPDSVASDDTRLGNEVGVECYCAECTTNKRRSYTAHNQRDQLPRKNEYAIKSYREMFSCTTIVHNCIYISKWSHFSYTQGCHFPDRTNSGEFMAFAHGKQTKFLHTNCNCNCILPTSHWQLLV